MPSSHSRMIQLIHNFFYSIVANSFSFVISLLVVFILPRYLGVQEYSYYQLFVFYSSFIGIAHLGWNDGIYLRYGGAHYEHLDKPLFFSQFYTLFSFQILISLFLYFISSVYIIDYKKQEIFKFIAFILATENCKCMLLYLMQASNLIHNYALTIIIDRFFFILNIIICIILNYRSFQAIITSDIMARIIAFLFIYYKSKDITYNNISIYKFNMLEIWKNISVGWKLMIANFANSLTIGIIRFALELTWGVKIFGQISLSLSVSHCMMVFINAVSLVLYPFLRRSSPEEQRRNFLFLRDFLNFILLGALLLYYPIFIITSQWLPQYIVTVRYMSIIFPVLICDGKISLLLNTYMKSLRKEKALLCFNAILLCGSALSVYITTHLLNNLVLSVILLPTILLTKCFIIEIYLSTLLAIPYQKAIISNVILITIFLIINNCKVISINLTIRCTIYFFAYITYILFNYKELRQVLTQCFNIYYLRSR